MRLWRIVIVTDTGREVPHWSDETRRSARESLERFRAAHPHCRFVLRRDS
jgi:hypothetical protein